MIKLSLPVSPEQGALPYQLVLLSFPHPFPRGPVSCSKLRLSPL